jgi:hypothetical protein
MYCAKQFALSRLAHQNYHCPQRAAEGGADPQQSILDAIFPIVS